MHLRIHHAMSEIPAARWDSLNRADYPFHSHAFLSALESHGGVEPDNGWAPHHMALYDDAGALLAGAPAYLKGHSWGEFVFDFAWADAYERHGHAYYPKMIGAVPFSPVTGPRVLHADSLDSASATRQLGRIAREIATDNALSSMHWLFPREPQAEHLLAEDYLHRLGLQYHWHNPGYEGFEDFLGALTSKKRKNIRRERRLVRDSGLSLEVRHGDEVSTEDWHRFHAFYEDTFARRGNIPFLTAGFFTRVGRALGWRVVLIIAREHGEMVAAALCFRDHDTLYGRYWGSLGYEDSLHFETCYYQGIEYCIAHGLKRFEPGAQGEHKIPRGFLPVITHSCHWITDGGFRAAIDDFLARERPAVEQRAALLARHSPYRKPAE
ncbi:N-acetyltransferase [Ectothiorhodospiraceae bacterium WFHF3C12]|nr:N-acetyltransferase [Ectothiorhodospiraceae bacterium WFHF3C12]